MDDTGKPMDFLHQTNIWTAAGGALVTRIEFEHSSEACRFASYITGEVEGAGVEEVVFRLRDRYLEIDLVPKSDGLDEDALVLAESVEEKLSETEFG
nr:MAG: hypothetical protein J07AB56_05160 [Candidatus Nanosalinarum sp. J07AB56]